MNLRLMSALLALTLALFLAGPARADGDKDCANCPNCANKNMVKLTILHTNDMHGQLLPAVDKKVAPEPSKVGGAAYMAAFIAQIRAEHPEGVLLFDSGDIAQGTPISNLFHGKPMMEYMNAVKYDAGTVGNHEFDWGPDTFSKIVRQANHPVVCANLTLKSTGKPPAGITEFIVKKVDGVNVGITGVITPETPTISFAKNVAPFTYGDPAAAVQKVLPRMKAAGAQVIIVLSHMGHEADQKLAQQVSGINVIVGGHSHKTLPEPIFVNDTVILQAGRYMRYLGNVHVCIDKTTWKVIDYTKKDALVAVLNDKVTPDPKVAAMVAKYQAEVAPAMEQVLGEAADDLTRTAPTGASDTALGNLITDALRWKASSDIAVYNAGGIRTDINKGPVKMSDVYTLLPFDNFVVTLSLNGKQVESLLGQGLGDNHGTIQVSGVTFAIDGNGKPTDIKVNGAALDPGKTYRVTTVDFLAEGNDGLLVLKEGTDRQYDELARDVFSAFVRKRTPLAPPEAGRIKRATTTSTN